MEEQAEREREEGHAEQEEEEEEREHEVMTAGSKWMLSPGTSGRALPRGRDVQLKNYCSPLALPSS